MGVFQKIRDNSLLTFILIGGSLLLFVLSDALSTGSMFSEGGESDIVGSFEGKDITIQDYEKMFNEVEFINKNGRNLGNITDREKQSFSQQSWNQLLMKKLIKQEGAALGLDVTDEEVEAMIAGDKPYPFYVYRLFGGPENFNQIRQNLIQNPDEYYNYTGLGLERSEMLKKFGVELRKQEKLVNLIQKSLINTQSIGENQFLLSNTKKDVRVANVPYYIISDSLISITTSEIKSYYEDNKDNFKLNQPRKQVKYAVFRLNPSNEDEIEVEQWANQTVELFKEETNDRLFVRQESELPFDDTYYKKGGGLETRLDTVLFQGKPKGYVYGPYVKFRSGKKTYNVAKIVNTGMLSDSMKVSHIQLTPDDLIQNLLAQTQNPSQEQINELWKGFDAMADSLYTAAKNNPSVFNDIAKKHSTDTISGVKGGDIGWIKEGNPQFAKKFIDSIFVNSEVGQIKKTRIALDNGIYYYHISRIDKEGPKTKKIQVGIVSRSVVPGNKTLDKYFNKANKLSYAVEEGADLNSLSDTLVYYVDSAYVQPQQFIVKDLEGARKVVRWAFNDKTEEGDPEVFELGDRYIVAIVNQEDAIDFQSIDNPQVQNDIKRILTRKKKFDYINEKLGSVNQQSFDEVMQSFPEASVEEFQNIGEEGVGKYSREFALTGTILGLSESETSSLIKGDNGAFIVNVLKANVPEVTESSDFTAELNELNDAGQKVDLYLQELITEKADVKDNRKIIQ